jgi:hypothetical protein
MKCADSDATDGQAHPREIIPKYRFSGPHYANTKGRFESTYQTIFKSRQTVAQTSTRSGPGGIKIQPKNY